MSDVFYSNMFPLFGDVANVSKKSDPESKLDISRCPWFPNVSNGNKTLQQKHGGWLVERKLHEKKQVQS